MVAAHLKKGQEAERLAEQHLIAADYIILERNLSSRYGEIDLIARKGKMLVFVEVRCRSNAQFGSAAASVTVSKQRKIIKAAEFFLAANPRLNSLQMRFDVIGIDANNSLQWIEGAFQVG